jgi:hypothetical protein
MDSAEIQEVSDAKICDAHGVNLGRGKRFPIIDAEVERRSLDCSAWVGAAVSDCSDLSITNAQRIEEPEGIAFTVVNKGQSAKNYRIYHVGIQSSRFEIQAGETQQVAMAFNPGMQVFGQITSGAGKAEAMLNECLNTYGSIPRQPPRLKSTDSAPAAVIAADPGTPTKALRNANMRSGPGTEHRILGLLKTGEPLRVLRVAGTWCECMTSDSRLVYVSCSLLAPPPSGWGTAPASAAAGVRAGQTFNPQIVFARGPKMPRGDCKSPEECREMMLRNMGRLGATRDALAFARRLSAGGTWGWAEEFRNYGTVDLIKASYPLRANTNSGWLLVNGSPDLVDVEEYDRGGSVTGDSRYRALLARNQNVFPYGHIGFLRHEARPGGRQRFVFSDNVGTCRACEPSASIEFAFDFAADGRLIGTSLLAVEAASR